MPHMETESNTPAVFLGNLQISTKNEELKPRIIELFSNLQMTIGEQQIRVYYDKTRELKYCFVDLYDDIAVYDALTRLNKENSKSSSFFSNILEHGASIKIGKGKYEEATELAKQSLYLGNLQKGIADDELRQHLIKLLKHFGTVVCEENIRVFENTDRGMKYCFVDVANESTVTNLVQSINDNAIPSNFKSAIVEQGLTLKVGRGKNTELQDMTKSSNKTYSVYLGNLQKELKDDELRRHIITMFKHYEIDVGMHQIRIYHNTDKGIRYCFVDFSDTNKMQHAVTVLSDVKSIPANLTKAVVASGLSLKVAKGKG